MITAGADMVAEERKEQPVVSVIVPTYQHVSYITECLESILAQRTSFPIEILIGEDESSDGTREICQRYVAAHPDRIHLFLGRRADVLYIQGKPTGRRNLLNLLKAAKGRYIAMCDGDDYWTDPLKLQKQVDLLESDPDCMLCFNRFDRLREDGLSPFPIPPTVDLANVRLDDILRTYNFIHHGSVMYRNVLQPLPDVVAQAPGADLVIYTLCAQRGSIRCLDESMGVWRMTGTGIWSAMNEEGKGAALLRGLELLHPLLTAEQRELAHVKRRTLLDRMATAKYPDSHVLRWFHRLFLSMKYRS